MTVLRIRILEQTGCFLGRTDSFLGRNDSRVRMNLEQIIITFLPLSFQYLLVAKEEEADICLFSICLTNKEELRDNEINIMICIENCSYFTHYPHINTYGEFGNEKIDIYFYNHFSNLFYQKSKLIIPTIYARLNYYQTYHQFIDIPSLDFKHKKFCLLINRSNLNPLIIDFYFKLQQIGNIDNIKDLNISDSSCYNSPEILKVFNQYKFIVCFENSKNDGYVTEKIFNCFFAKSIPLYWGSDKVTDFLNPQSFIKVDDIQNFNYALIKNLNEDENEYNKIVNQPKINPSFANDNCYKLMEDIIKSKLQL